MPKVKVKEGMAIGPLFLQVVERGWSWDELLQCCASDCSPT